MATAGIYVITNSINGKRYIGSAVKIERRLTRHRYDLRHGLHPNGHLQAAWKKYGEEAFSFEVLERTSDLLAREQCWLDQLWKAEPGLYNICPQAGAPSRGRKLSDEHKAKIKASLMGHKVSEETKRAVGEQNAQRRHTEETREKLSRAANNNKGKPIEQVSSDGKVVAEFRSAHHARQAGFPGVERALLGRCQMVRGFYWVYIAQ